MLHAVGLVKGVHAEKCLPKDNRFLILHEYRDQPDKIRLGFLTNDGGEVGGFLGGTASAVIRTPHSKKLPELKKYR